MAKRPDPATPPDAPTPTTSADALPTTFDAVFAPPSGEIKFELSQESVVAVLVQGAQDQLEAERDAAIADADRLVQEAAPLAKQLEERIAAASYGDLVDRVDAAVAALAALHLTASATYSRGNHSSEKRTYQVMASIRVDGTSYCLPTIREDLPMDAAMNELCDRLDALDKERAAYTTVASAARRQLADLTRLERRARAMVAENALGRSETGRQLLAAVKEGMAQKSDLGPLRRQLGLPAS
jgi:hypothetical protein